MLFSKFIRNSQRQFVFLLEKTTYQYILLKAEKIIFSDASVKLTAQYLLSISLLQVVVF